MCGANATLPRCLEVPMREWLDVLIAVFAAVASPELAGEMLDEIERSEESA